VTSDIDHMGVEFAIVPARQCDGQVRIAHKACGLNYIDVYQRTGLYPLSLPQALGMEAAGVIEAVGAGVTHVKVGDRVAYASMPPGSYCERRVMPAAQVCPLPG